MIRKLKCFQISDFLCARIHFLTHICQRDAAFIHHYQKMIENIVNLTYQFRFFAVFCSNNGFSTLFSHFFQDFIQAFLKQIAGIRTCLGCARRCTITDSICSNEFILLFLLTSSAVPQRQSVITTANTTIAAAVIINRNTSDINVPLLLPIKYGKNRSDGRCGR